MLRKVHFVFDENYSVLEKPKKGVFLVELVQLLGNKSYHR